MRDETKDFPVAAGSLAQAAAEFGPWFHNLHLPDGTQTAPGHVLGDFPAYKWAEIAPFLPEDLHGWEALDIGCNAGFYSLELARRGARVTAVDRNPKYLRQAAWAAGEFGLQERIEFRQLQLYQLAAQAAWRRYFGLRSTAVTRAPRRASSKL